jgi:hypothetical protein
VDCFAPRAGARNNEDGFGASSRTQPRGCTALKSKRNPGLVARKPLTNSEGYRQSRHVLAGFKSRGARRYIGQSAAVVFNRRRTQDIAWNLALFVQDRKMSRDWDDFVKGFAESLKQINATLTELGQADIYKYFDTVFDRIAASYVLDPVGCQDRFDREIESFLSKLQIAEALNKLTILMIYHLVYREWKSTLRHPPVHILIKAVVRYYRRYAATKSEAQQYIYNMLFVLFDILAGGMRIENSLNINCTAGIKRHSETIDQIVIPEDRFSNGRDAPDASLVKWAKAEADDGKHYFAALHRLSTAVMAWRENEADWQRAASDALAFGREIIADHLEEDTFIYATELDAHLQTLVQMDEFGPSQALAKHFKVIYCYPFIIRGMNTHEIVPARHVLDRLEAVVADWKSWCASDEMVGGVGNDFRRAAMPSSQEEVELTDVWSTPAEMTDLGSEETRGAAASANGKSAANGRRVVEHYALQAINLPNIIIHDVADTAKQIILHCEIRISAFGNHYVRLYAERGDQKDFIGFDAIKHHDIHRVLRRASSLCGKEPISIEAENGTPAYRNFPGDADGLYKPDSNVMDVVKKLIQCFDQALRKHGMRADHDIAKTSNVIFSLVELSNGPAALTQKFEDAFHRLFVNPIGGPADRLDPWLSRSNSRKRDGKLAVTNLAQGELGDDAQIYTTANTTLIRLPSHANFVRLDYEEMAEFVATLEPLYSYWNAEISRRMEQVLEDLGVSKVAKIEKDRIGLQQVVVSAQKAMLDIESPAIVTNSVYRSYLNAFIRKSTVGALKKNFQDLTSTTQDVVNTVSDYAQKREDKWIQKQRYVWATLLALAAFAVSLGQLTEYKLLCVNPEVSKSCVYYESDFRALRAYLGW